MFLLWVAEFFYRIFLYIHSVQFWVSLALQNSTEWAKILESHWDFSIKKEGRELLEDELIFNCETSSHWDCITGEEKMQYFI